MADHISFQRREFKGSRYRCLVATGLSRTTTAAFLNELVMPHASVRHSDTWQPCGFLQPDEACLGDAADFLSDAHRESLTTWWLSVRERANTPNWDIVSTCEVDGRPGLLLVEAKAHAGELHSSGLGATNEANHRRITSAIAEANDGLGGTDNGWNLSAGRNYQLCNRLVWAWKVASLGVPVVLVYLGFLDATEMGRGALASRDQWRQSVLRHSNGVVPDAAWDQRHEIGEAVMIPLIGSARIGAMVD